MRGTKRRWGRGGEGVIKHIISQNKCLIGTNDLSISWCISTDGRHEVEKYIENTNKKASKKLK